MMSNHAKGRIIARFVKRRAERLDLEGRNPNQLRRLNPEETAEVLHRQRAEREAAIVETKDKGEWLQVSEIVKAVIKAKDQEFDEKKRTRIEITLCNDIVSDSADGLLGTEQSPAFMLLSKDYDETILKPSELAQALETGFDRVYGDEKRQTIAIFLMNHGWLRRSVAASWLGPQVSLPRPPQKRVSNTVKTQTSCRQWLMSAMEAHELRTKPKEDFYREAKQKFKVGRRAFNRAWDEAIASTGRDNWRKAGRPRKS
jgi:hypothetical protein